jgi:hypothetical protein
MKALASAVCGILVVAAAPAIADPVKCGDGTTDTSRSGACKSHGGIVDGRAKPRAERPRATKRSQARTMTMRMRSRAPVLCNDGTRAAAGSTCSQHDGVAGKIGIDRLDTEGPRAVASPGLILGPGLRCADGTRTLVPGKDACVDHGGVIGAKAAEPRLDGSATARRSNSDAAARRSNIDRDAAARRTESPRRTTGPVLCNDGTMSGANGRTCVKHGGISNSAGAFEHHDGPIRARPTTPDVELCADDTTSASGPAACVHHGGVVKQRPPSQGEPTEAGTPVAVCKDGAVARSDHAGGVCSYHGGVSSWL